MELGTHGFLVQRVCRRTDDGCLRWGALIELNAQMTTHDAALAIRANDQA